MSLLLENGWWAAGAAALLALVGMLWHLARRRSWRWKMACVGLPGAAAVLMALALVEPAVVWNPVAQRVVILLDLSASTRVSPWRNPAWLRGLAQLRLARASAVTIVGFGGAGSMKVLVEDAPVNDAGRWPIEWPSIEEGSRPDLNSAMAWRSAAEARGEVALAPRWIVTDGLLQSTQALNQKAFDMGWTAIAPATVDVGVVEMGVRPDDKAPGTQIWTRVRATGKTDAILEVLRNGQPVARQGVSFAEAGSRWISVHDPAAASDSASGMQRYDLSIQRQPSADPWPENDRGSLLWMPETAAARVLVVGDPESTETLGGAGAIRGIVAARQFPGDVGPLVAAGWQVILLNDVPLATDQGDPAGGVLAPQSAAAIDAFVRETGGGLVIVGRKHAFGPGHYAEAGNSSPADSIEALSPVWSQPRDRPAAHVVFILDASGSMNDVVGAGTPEQKFKVVARGVEQALTLLKEEDHVTVLTFSDHAQVVAEGTKAELIGTRDTQDLLRQRLNRVQPTGNTVPDTALPNVETALANPPAEAVQGSVMVVLLTDGEIPALDVAKWKGALAKSSARLTIVAPPPGADSALAKLARDVDATWLATKDAGEWTVLLKRAVAREITGKAMSTPLPWHTLSLDNAALQGSTREWIEVWKKTESREIVAGEKMSPGQTLGAVAQRGLGRVAAVAMGGNDEAYVDLLRRLVKEVMPAAGDRRFALWSRREGGGWVIGADGVEGRKFLDGQRLKVRVLAAPPTTDVPSQRQIEMHQTGAGRYEAYVAMAQAIAAVVVRDGKTGEELVGRIQPARVETGEWPASVEQPAETPAGAQVISADETATQLWLPRIRGSRVSLTATLWVASALAALAGLWVRRGPGR